MSRLLRNDGSRLDAGRSSSNNSHPLTGKVDLLLRPLASVIPAASERVHTFVLGHLRNRQASGGHHAVLGSNLIAMIRLNGPTVRDFVESCRRHSRVELNVPSQAEAVGDVIQIAQDFRLGGIPLRPVPLLLQLLREGVRVLQTLDVASSARVTVPKPGAPDATCCLVNAR